MSNKGFKGRKKQRKDRWIGYVKGMNNEIMGDRD